MIVTFSGNSDFRKDIDTEKKIIEILKICAKKAEKVYCFCGGYGHFDYFAAACVNKVKRTYPNIVNCLITAYITLPQQKNLKFLEANYDEIIYPPLENVPPRYAIPERNKWMINCADLVIAHVENYFGGAAKTLKYAEKKNKKIFYLKKI